MHPWYFIANLKMNVLSREEMRQYLSLLRREAEGKNFSRVRGVICPPVLYLSELEHLPGGFHKGAQNAFFEKSGAYTGEISPLMLKNDGVEYVILGHSERRLYGRETNEEVKKKTLLALKHHLRPVVCIGETAEERKKEKTETVLEEQMKSLFEGLSKLQAEEILLAYEPRWAIGANIFPKTEEILQVRVMARKILTEMFDAALALRVQMLYGGSVKSAFLPQVSWEAGMNGVIVGSESLFPHEVVKMMSLFEERAEKKSQPRSKSLKD